MRPDHRLTKLSREMAELYSYRLDTSVRAVVMATAFGRAVDRLSLTGRFRWLVKLLLRYAVGIRVEQRIERRGPGNELLNRATIKVRGIVAGSVTRVGKDYVISLKHGKVI